MSDDTSRCLGGGRLTGRALVVALVVALLTVTLWPEIADARTRVLLMFDEDKDFPGLALINRSLREGLGAGLRGGVEFYSESMNLSQFKDRSYDDVLRDYLHRKYAGKRLDLVVAVMEPTLDFLLRHGDTVFPGTPIVFCGADASDIEGKTLKANVTGIVVRRTFAPTLDIALRLQPETRHVFVVAGTSRFDERLLAIARRDFRPFESRAVITYLTPLPMDDLLTTLATLPHHSVVLFLTFFADGGGHSFVPHEALTQITRVANAPVYVSLDQYFGLGTVGGHVYSVAAHGRQAAEMGLRILRGETVSSVPVLDAGTHTGMFDWRQLQRWRLDERRLPPGSIISFRPPSVWNLYKWYIVGAATLVLVQSLLIVGLLVSRAQRRQAQRTLIERLQFETLLSELSTAFLTIPTSAVEASIAPMLRRVVEGLDLDRAALAEREEGTSIMRVKYSWTRPGIAPVPDVSMGEETLPWATARLVQGDVVRISRLDALPEDAATDRRSLAALGVRSLAVVPLMVDGKVVGTLGFGRLRGERVWSDRFMAGLQLLADVFANVLARRRADTAVQESEERRHQAEEEAQRQRDELAHALRVSTLGELTASFAHELNQPLTAIMTNAQATRRLLTSDGAAPQDVTEALVDIVAETQRAAETIRRLRTLFRKEHGERTAVDINALIADVLGLLGADLRGKHIAVRFRRADSLPAVLGDPVQLRQVVLNLLVNAAEAIAPAADGPREIHVTTGQPDDEHIAIAVRDSGVGVKEADLERIFEHFVSTKREGLGMGLAISRSIVEAHGGRIWAVRNDDRGLTLQIQFPVKPERCPDLARHALTSQARRD